ncbi:MAG: 16S rRNA (adenine(1518)-N(6)/adenine(1519)-N(6))-dimethyltransferase RsmA [Herpetosiphonaceae bacterium]|nr:16S rRNA (adenine(1518)-N(6)/adenine(1519)-N(6))-dimethyltransferase RsmA [Herpetosiphonaceae bacterium]
MTTNPYLQPGRIQAALNTLGVRPSKELGQNFLIDAEALQAVVDAADLQPTDTVIEVGPGLGVLTYELVQRAGQVIAIEFDRRLATRLTEAIEVPHLRVVQSDVLRIEPAEVVGAAGHYKLVANLPYQITSAILRHFLEAALPPALAVVMVQREVAERIVARPPHMSVLAHSVQLYTVPEIVRWVPAAAFLPVPKVDSAVLRLHRRPQLAVEVDDVDAFFRVIKAGFLQARKKLGNALSIGLASFGTPLAKTEAIELLKGVDIDPDRRAETLTLEEWAQVYRALQHRSAV